MARKYLKTHVTKRYIRKRIAPPSSFIKGSFRTLSLPGGKKLIIGHPKTKGGKKSPGTKAQAVLIPRDNVQNNPCVKTNPFYVVVKPNLEVTSAFPHFTEASASDELRDMERMFPNRKFEALYTSSAVEPGDLIARDGRVVTRKQLGLQNPTMKGKPKMWFPKKGSEAAKDIGALLQKMRKAVGDEKEKLRKLFRETRAKWMARDMAAGKKAEKSTKKNPWLMTMKGVPLGAYDKKDDADLFAAELEKALLAKAKREHWDQDTIDAYRARLAYVPPGKLDERHIAHEYRASLAPSSKALPFESEEDDEGASVGSLAEFQAWQRRERSKHKPKTVAELDEEIAELEADLPKEGAEGMQRLTEEEMTEHGLDPEKFTVFGTPRKRARGGGRRAGSKGRRIGAIEAQVLAEIKGEKPLERENPIDMAAAIAGGIASGATMSLLSKKNPYCVVDRNFTVVGKPHDDRGDAYESKARFDFFAKTMGRHHGGAARYGHPFQVVHTPKVKKEGDYVFDNPNLVVIGNPPRHGIKVPVALERQILRAPKKDQPEILKGVEKYYEFHGCFPKKLIARNVDHGKMGLPLVNVGLGWSDRVEYRSTNEASNKFFAGGKGKYVHKFGDELPRGEKKNAKPMLVTDPSGKTLHYLPSRFKVKDWIHH